MRRLQGACRAQRRISACSQRNGGPTSMNGVSTSSVPNLSGTFAAPHHRGNMLAMALATTKLTAQGQVSVPAEVRRRLGIGPGSVLEWVQQGDHFVPRRVGTHTSEQIHSALFPK
jgi:AbrB family looped-hinge helix DNA binding protein